MNKYAEDHSEALLDRRYQAYSAAIVATRSKKRIKR